MYDETLVKKKLILSKIHQTPGDFTKVGVTTEMKYKYRLSRFHKNVWPKVNDWFLNGFYRL